MTSFTTEGPIGSHQRFVRPTVGVSQITMVAMAQFQFYYNVYKVAF